MEGIGHIAQLNTLAPAQIVTIVCLIVVFVCVILNLLFSVLRRKTSVAFNLLPLFAIIAIIIFTMTKANENVAETLQTFGTGFFIMFIGSFLLPFTSIAVTNTANG